LVLGGRRFPAQCVDIRLQASESILHLGELAFKRNRRGLCPTPTGKAGLNRRELTIHSIKFLFDT
jgi:hypothetical protein